MSIWIACGVCVCFDLTYVYWHARNCVINVIKVTLRFRVSDNVPILRAESTILPRYGILHCVCCTMYHMVRRTIHRVIIYPGMAGCHSRPFLVGRASSNCHHSVDPPPLIKVLHGCWPPESYFVRYWVRNESKTICEFPTSPEHRPTLPTNVRITCTHSWMALI